MKNIVVTGATGTVGISILPFLLQKDVAVKAITRSAHYLNMTDPKLTVVEADIARPETLQDTLQQADALFLTGGLLEMDTIQKGVIDAAQTQGVPFIVKLSAMGAASDSPVKMFQRHYTVEEYLKASGMAYCLLQPNSFTQNLFMYAPSIKEQGTIHAALGEGKVSYIDVRDIARVAAAVLLSEPDKHRNQTCVLTGPEAQSMQQNADTIGEVIGKKITYHPISYQESREAMLGYGMQEWLVDDLVGLARIGAEGDASRVTNDVEEVTGKAPHSVRQTVEEYQDIFRQ